MNTRTHSIIARSPAARLVGVAIVLLLACSIAGASAGPSKLAARRLAEAAERYQASAWLPGPARSGLPLPGLSFEVVRPKEVLLVGYDLDGTEMSIEADEILARLFQHELDHLDGVLLIDHLEKAERKHALKLWTEREDLAPPSGGGLSLP